jgi:hypothetical protein
MIIAKKMVKSQLSMNKMKKLIQKIKEWFFPKAAMAPNTYILYWENVLTSAQIQAIINKMISVFPSYCRPNRITVSSSATMLEFTQICMSGEMVKNVAEKTLENNHTPAKVTSVKLNGEQVWPVI